MKGERLLEAMGEVDDEILYFKYHLKNVAWAILMGIVTMILCLFVAERILGVSGFVISVEYRPDGEILSRVNPHLKIGLWFRRVCLVLIPLIFSRKVRWRYTWVNFFVYFFLYFPIRAIVGYWPAMGYLADNTGFLALPWILNPIFMMCHFWLVQSAVFAVVNFVRFLWRKRKGLDKMPPVC